MRTRIIEIINTYYLYNQNNENVILFKEFGILIIKLNCPTLLMYEDKFLSQPEMVYKNLKINCKFSTTLWKRLPLLCGAYGFI